MTRGSNVTTPVVRYEEAGGWLAPASKCPVWSSSAHHWARKLGALGLDARIISAQLVSPYRSEGATGKNDANDAAAICEAASRPTMRFIPMKSIEQQSMLCVHRLREGIKEDRTACINRIRGLLAEFGLVFAQGARELQAVLGDVLEDASNELGTLARLTLQRAQSPGPAGGCRPGRWPPTPATATARSSAKA